MRSGQYFPPDGISLACTPIFFAVTEPYLLIAWSRVLLEKLTGVQLFKKFPAFYETPRFITAFKSAHHLSLYSATSIQSMPPNPLLEDPF
jgi:hypothetical protein